MVLDVPTPDPPSLRGPQSRGDYEAIDDEIVDTGDSYCRQEVAGLLEAGAWQDAFEEWATGAGLSTEAFAVIERLDLIEAFDLYWDPASDEVGYRAPELPDDAADEYDFGDPDGIDVALDDLGRIVSEVLENDYVLRDEDDFGFFDDEDEAYGDRDE